MKQLTDESENEIRRLRDAAFGQKSTDTNWEACKQNWMRPDSIEWLKAQEQTNKLIR